MHGLRDPSFLPTKKNPAPAGDEDGWMIPAVKDSERYFSVASVSGLDSETSSRDSSVVPDFLNN